MAANKVNTDRWLRIKEVFGDALQREPAERSAFLAGACAGDSDLRAEVEKLLDSYQTDFMAGPAIGEMAESMSAKRQQLKAGQRLGRYRITQPIGAGGMGEVYLAHDTELERDVALKILAGDVAADQQRMQRFIQEAKTASALNHPNIITIYEVGQAEGLRFIATEYIKGETLPQSRRPRRPPPPKFPGARGEGPGGGPRPGRGGGGSIATSNRKTSCCGPMVW